MSEHLLTGAQQAVAHLSQSSTGTCVGQDLDIGLAAIDNSVQVLCDSGIAFIKDPEYTQALDKVIDKGFFPVNPATGSFVSCPGEINNRCNNQCLSRAILRYGYRPVLKAFEIAKKLANQKQRFENDSNAPAKHKTRKRNFRASFGKKATLKAKNGKERLEPSRQSGLSVIETNWNFPNQLSEIEDPPDLFTSRQELVEVRHPSTADQPDPPPNPTHPCDV